MFTLATLEANEWLLRWNHTAGKTGKRAFLYAESWRKDVESLPEITQTGLVRPASMRARVLGLVDQFVAGDLKATLVRPIGNGMEPPFPRMRDPHSVVVEMRTEQTRSFGFFARPNCYVALLLKRTDDLKLPNRRADPAKYGRCALAVETFLGRLTPTDIDRITAIDLLITDDFSGG